MRNLLENHITNQGLAAIEKLGDEALNDPKIYVTQILEVHRKYNALVLTAFNNDAGFVASLDKACGKFRCSLQLKHPNIFRIYSNIFLR